VSGMQDEWALKGDRSRAGIVLGVLLLHGALASWLAGQMQRIPSLPSASSIAVQWRPATPPLSPVMQPPKPRVAAKASHPRKAMSPAPRPAPAMPPSPARPSAPSLLSANAAAALSAPAAVPAPANVVADPHPPVSSEAGFSADYLHNPTPAYPPAARRNGEEGRVLLRVRVSAGGQAEAVDIQRSSGFPRLDEAAREAVASWRFTPARRGAADIASSVIVPITFRLGH